MASPTLHRSARPTSPARVEPRPVRPEPPRRIPTWISDVHQRAAGARAELLRRIAKLLEAPAPRAGQ